MRQKPIRVSVGDRNGLQLATLIPVLGRPHRVQPLINSFLESRTPGLLVFIVQLDDIDELIEVRKRESGDIRVIEVIEARTWPEKINTAIQQVHADWYMCAADDVLFHKGWWKATEQLRKDPTVGVIGTNDMGNPRVLAGEHTTHPLIRRQYVLDHGTLDQPGIAIHEGYKHWYCDDELVITAKMRGAWAFCRDAKVQHLHPYWEPEIPVDDTYRLGESSADEDRAVFINRMSAHIVENVT